MRLPKQIKIPLLLLIATVGLAFVGYIFILFGGRLVVDQEALVLKATTTIETEDGEILGRLYEENRTPVEIQHIPPQVQDAFIAIEDRRFHSHAGVDFKSIVRAVYRDLIAFHKVEGASTITQQLAKNLFLSNEKTWMRKTKEVMAAIYLERKWPKADILELYLNTIYFGHGVYGIETAAQKFFSKSIEDVTVPEAALLAGIINSPSRYSPIDHPEKALERRNQVLRAMEQKGTITTEERLQYEGQTLGLNLSPDQSPAWAQSYMDLVLKEAKEMYQLSDDELRRGGYRIVVALDPTVQKIAEEHFKNDAYFPGNVPGVEGAFIMLNHQTGEIIAAIGGRSYRLGDFNRVLAKRQPGSTLKPLAVYGPAMMTENYHPYSLLQDEALNYDGYIATNIDGQYAGEITLYDAIVQSKNAPAVWLLNELGISYGKEYLEKMNLWTEDEGLSIALGGLTEGFSPLELAAAYQTFAQSGSFAEPYTIRRIYDRNNELFAQAKQKKHPVFSAQVAWNMTEILEATVQKGTAKAGKYPKALAGKTGSTEHLHVTGKYKDAWFVGYTPEYVTALWMGYDHSDAHHYLEGGSQYPTELTKAILKDLDLRVTLSTEFKKPKQVEALPEPIRLPEIEAVDASFTFGGLSLIKGKLTWKSTSTDERVIYRIYRVEGMQEELIGEAIGENTFIIDDVSLFKPNKFYIVPYDPLTDREGKPSKTVELSLK